MKTNLFAARVLLVEHTGTIGSARLEATLEDAKIREKVDPRFNGLEHVSVKLPLKGGGERSVDLTKLHSQRAVTEPFGRVPDRHTLLVSADDYDLAALRSRTLTFEVADQKGSVLASAEVKPETLWG